MDGTDAIAAQAGQGPVYEGNLELRQARQAYFDAWGFGDGGYEATWVALNSIAGIPIGFPNTDSRRRTVKLHDLHHVLTGYRADWVGEAEIAAWELGAGCYSHLPAWFLNLGAIGYGMYLAPGKLLRAMARGRRSRSLYRAPELDESLLARKVGDIRQELHIPDAARPTAADAAALAGYWLASTLFFGAPLWILAVITIALVS